MPQDKSKELLSLLRIAALDLEHLFSLCFVVEDF